MEIPGSITKAWNDRKEAISKQEQQSILLMSMCRLYFYLKSVDYLREKFFKLFPFVKSSCFRLTWQENQAGWFGILLALWETLSS